MSGTPTSTPGSGTDLPDWVRDSLRCPVCAATLHEDAAASVVVCDGAERHRFPVVDGIARLIAD
jgi:hypothetical protein